MKNIQTNTIMTTTDYQKGLFTELKKIFPITEYEWRAFKTGDKHKYGPRVDIAIGPFNDEDVPAIHPGTFHAGWLCNSAKSGQFRRSFLKFEPLENRGL